ncbi:GATA transcription factor 15-like [Mangifera indica]|uniref:GATA transcription factor 15-like n=1 Tax=Mangifera indica TaxID=29780 RepID=UPI001CF9D5B3|nr:GATA transcription factor 15-like [Mangifera indica]
MNTKGSEPEVLNSSPPSVFSKMKKSCIDCHTTTTPLWRGGPAGPRSLCNACGIRYRKTKKALLGLDKGRAEKCKRKNSKDFRKLGVSLKMGLMGIGEEMSFQKSLREEEEAAMLLMTLSCGYMSMPGP